MAHIESNGTNMLKHDHPDLSKREPAFYLHLDLFISLSWALLDVIYVRHARTCIQEKKQRLDPNISKPLDLQCSLCGEGEWLDPGAPSGSRRLTACHSIEIWGSVLVMYERVRRFFFLACNAPKGAAVDIGMRSRLLSSSLSCKPAGVMTIALNVCLAL